MRADPDVDPCLPRVAEPLAIHADDSLSLERMTVCREEGIDTIGVLSVDGIGAMPPVLRRRPKHLVEAILRGRAWCRNWDEDSFGP